MGGAPDGTASRSGPASARDPSFKSDRIAADSAGYRCLQPRRYCVRAGARFGVRECGEHDARTWLGTSARTRDPSGRRSHARQGCTTVADRIDAAGIRGRLSCRSHLANHHQGKREGHVRDPSCGHGRSRPPNTVADRPARPDLHDDRSAVGDDHVWTHPGSPDHTRPTSSQPRGASSRMIGDPPGLRNALVVAQVSICVLLLISTVFSFAGRKPSEASMLDIRRMA